MRGSRLRRAGRAGGSSARARSAQAGERQARGVRQGAAAGAGARPGRGWALGARPGLAGWPGLCTRCTRLDFQTVFRLSIFPKSINEHCSL